MPVNVSYPSNAVDVYDAADWTAHYNFTLPAYMWLLQWGAGARWSNGTGGHTFLFGCGEYV